MEKHWRDKTPRTCLDQFWEEVAQHPRREVSNDGLLSVQTCYKDLTVVDFAGCPAGSPLNETLSGQCLQIQYVLCGSFSRRCK